MKLASYKPAEKPKRIDGSRFLMRDMATLSADLPEPGAAWKRPDYRKIVEGLEPMLAASRDVIFVGSCTAVREVYKHIQRDRPGWIVVEAHPRQLYLMETWGL